MTTENLDIYDPSRRDEVIQAYRTAVYRQKIGTCKTKKPYEARACGVTGAVLGTLAGIGIGILMNISPGGSSYPEYTPINIPFLMGFSGLVGCISGTAIGIAKGKSLDKKRAKQENKRNIRELRVYATKFDEYNSLSGDESLGTQLTRTEQDVDSELETRYSKERLEGIIHA
ncbi:MAG: hypothetical protein NTX24_04795 [Candidatus Pacearchaeota archaeon]|nr:hypothetical protein [Candidatus Pacearchaeota archaeon]